MGVVLSIVLSGLLVGALGRLALPGPDPMPIWQTILLGIAGSIVGGLVAGLLGLTEPAYLLSLAIAGAALLLYLHRRFVQRRPIIGPGARRRLRR